MICGEVYTPTCQCSPETISARRTWPWATNSSLWAAPPDYSSPESHSSRHGGDSAKPALSLPAERARNPLVGRVAFIVPEAAIGLLARCRTALRAPTLALDLTLRSARSLSMSLSPELGSRNTAERNARGCASTTRVHVRHPRPRAQPGHMSACHGPARFVRPKAEAKKTRLADAIGLALIAFDQTWGRFEQCWPSSATFVLSTECGQAQQHKCPVSVALVRTHFGKARLTFRWGRHGVGPCWGQCRPTLRGSDRQFKRT